MGNNLSLAAGGGGGGSSTPSSPDDDTQSFHTAEDDTTNNNNINSDQNHNNTTASIDACNKIIAATQNATPSSPPKHITLQDSYSSTSSSNINDDKNIINNNYDNNLINTHNKNVSSARMVCNNNNNNSHNPEATSSTFTASASLDDSIYPVCNAQLIESNKSAALILESLYDDVFIDQLVKQGYERRVVCEVLAENGYGNEGFYGGQFNVQKLQLILYQIQEHQNSMIGTNNEDEKPSGSVSTLYNSPSHGRKGSGNNNMNDGDAIGDITDGVSKLRSPSGAVHSPMKSPSKELSHNDKRIKQTTINNNETCANDICTQNNVSSIGTSAVTAVANTNNDIMEVDSVTPAINRTATLQSSLPNVFVKIESNNAGGISAEPDHITNNQHIKLEEEENNPTTGFNANGYSQQHTLQSMLWSNTATAAVNTTTNNNNQTQPQLDDMFSESADIDTNCQIGDDSQIDMLVGLMNNLDEAEQMLGYDVDNPEELIDLLLSQSQDRDWIPEGMDHPFQSRNWVLNRDESVQLCQDTKIGFRQPLTVAESKSFFGPYGTARRLCPLFKHMDRTKYNTTVGRVLMGKGVEDLEDIKCRCNLCHVEVRLARIPGGLLVYEREDPTTGLPYRHNKTGHKNQSMDGKSTPMSLSFEQKEFVLERMGKQSCSQICYDMLSDNSITKTAEQKKNSKALTSVISDWMSNPSTKEKYMKHEWRQEDFTNSEVNDILESLMESPNTSPGHADFMDSSYYQSMKKHLNVIQHDYGDGGDKKFVLFETKDIAQRVELAGLMFDDEEGDNKNAVQINCDFAHIPGTGMVLGTCGVDDFKRKDWLTSFCVCPAEDAEMAEKVMRATVVRIDADARARRDKALIDGAGALKKAARALLLKVRECHAHIVRMALRRGGGKRGSKGSLSRYLLTNMGLGYKDMAKV